jgi:hypothetical protein
MGPNHLHSAKELLPTIAITIVARGLLLFVVSLLEHSRSHQSETLVIKLALSTSMSGAAKSFDASNQSE